MSRAQLAQVNAGDPFWKSGGSCLQGVTDELLTTVVTDTEGSASREKVLRTVRAVIDHARDRDGHLTTLDFNSSLIVPCTNVSKSGSLDPWQ